jgi:tRNA pseudouridine38-40 synthase
MASNIHDDKREKRKRATDSPTSTSRTCSKCGLVLSSRNQLFQHLRSSINTCSSPADENDKNTTTTAPRTTKVVLIVAYLGKRYHGSARNDPHDSVPTVEGCLWKAIAETLQDHETFSHRIEKKTNPNGMTRSSRTDKGVSALGNVYSLMLPCSFGNETDFVPAVNRCLPDDIRLLRSIHPIPLSFHARTCCEARRYRYFVPAKVLFRTNMKEQQQQEESIMDLRKRLKRVLLEWGGTHSFHNFSNLKKPSSQMNSRAINPSKADSHSADEEEDDNNDTASSFRHILRCHVEDVIQHDHMDFVVISIKGQSFVYHQIRKMMGATIGVMNQSLPDDFITNAFKEENTEMDVPLAPAEGLMLVEAIYSKHCSKHNIEPIGLGTKRLYRDKTNDVSSTQDLASTWEAATAKLQQDTNDFQKRVDERICNDQKMMFQL